jgi:hypothetical protein
MSWDSDGEQRYGGWPPMQRRMGFGNTLAARLLLPCVCLFTRSWSLCTLNIRRTPCCHPDVIFLLSQCCKNLHETVEHLTVYALPLTISKSFWRALLVSRMDLSSSSTVFANWFFFAGERIDLFWKTSDLIFALLYTVFPSWSAGNSQFSKGPNHHHFLLEFV